MTVKELISKLQDFDPEMEVFFWEDRYEALYRPDKEPCMVYDEKDVERLRPRVLSQTKDIAAPMYADSRELKTPFLALS